MATAHVARYKRLLSDLLARRGSDSPPSAEEEAVLAEQREKLWNRIPLADRRELEQWIDERMTTEARRLGLRPGGWK